MGGQFRLRSEHDGGDYRLSLTGELDIATVPQFEQALGAACADGAKSITVDLSGLAFIDSTGLRALLAGGEICVSHGSEYWIDRNMSPPVKRLLEIAGVGRVPFAGLP
jgi:anti-sigma B factor antagonist